MIAHGAQAYGLEVVSSSEEGGRAGLYFLEVGVPPRPSTVLYDRKESAPSHLSAHEFEWEKVLEGASAVHITGITCALGEGPMEAALRLFKAAGHTGVMTSFDVNNRTHLWDGDQAVGRYRRILPLVDTLFVSPSDLSMLCGRDADTDSLADQVISEYSITTLVIRERLEVSPVELGTRVRVMGPHAAYAEASGYVVDEIGAGDAAAGAFLASLLCGESGAVSAQRCVRAYARMLTIPGDMWSGSVHDLAEGYVSTRSVVR